MSDDIRVIRGHQWIRSFGGRIHRQDVYPNDVIELRFNDDGSLSSRWAYTGPGGDGKADEWDTVPAEPEA